jgi:AsmA protein
MNRIIKWLLIIGGGLIVLIPAVLFIVSMFIDVQKYRPEIENYVSEATGRPFALGEDLRLSLFPWVSLTLSDIHLGNPPGFEEKDLVSVKFFEMRVKLIPILFRDIQVKRFILKGARIVLERSKDGIANWEGVGKKEMPKPPERKPREGLSIKALAVGEFAITDSSILWIDNVKGERFDISDVSLHLQDVSLDRPVHIVFSARLDKHPLSLDGYVGPLGKDLGKGTIPLDLSVSALKQLDMKLKGNVINPTEDPRFDMVIDVSSFSPRKVAAAMKQPFPVATTDPKALTRMAFKANLKGDAGNVSISDGILYIDESKLNFSGKVGDFSRPDVTFDLSLDEIDLDRYLPPKTEEKSDKNNKRAGSPGPNEKKHGATAPMGKKMDYTPFRRLVLNGSLRMGKLKVNNVKVQDLYLKIAGRNGIFNLDPLTFKLYQGDMSVSAGLNVKQDIPKSDFTLKAKGIQAGPLLRELLGKDILEGTANAEMTVYMTGDDAEGIKKTLNGKGDFLVEDGAIKGIDLVGMVRNTDGAYGFAHKGEKRPQTEFTELNVPFTIENGVLYTPKTSMVSTLVHVQATGKANLISEALDFVVKPTVVTTSKEDKDKMKRSEVMVPVLVSGSFSSPKFRPDLKGIAKQKLEEKVFESPKFKKIFEKDEYKPFEEKAKSILRGIFDKK